MPLDPATPLAHAIALDPGCYALLIGAGVSLGAGMPSAWDVRRELALRVAIAEGCEAAAQGDSSSPEKPLEWFESHTGLPATYDGLLSHLAPSASTRRKTLAKHFAPTGAESNAPKSPSPAHQSVAELAKAGRVRIIITLNFDHLIEDALRHEGVDPHVVSSDDAIADLGPLRIYDCLVVHLHGDYTSLKMRNTPEELSHYPKPVRRFLKRVQQDYGLITLGWSAQWDVALREIVATPRGPAHYPLYWVDPQPASEGARSVIAARKAVECPSTAEDFLRALVDRCDALANTTLRHPLDSASLAQAARRDLLNPSVRPIRSHEVFRAEVKRLQESEPLSILLSGGTQQYDLIAQATRAALDDSKPLAAMIAILAYWGTKETDSWWIEAVPAVFRPNSGNTINMNHALSPGAVLLSTGLVAATAAGRAAPLVRCFRERGPLPNVGSLLDLYGPPSIGGSTPSRDLFGLVAPILNEHLLLTGQQTREAWDNWQYLTGIRAMHVYEGIRIQGGEAPPLLLKPPHIRRSWPDKNATILQERRGLVADVTSRDPSSNQLQTDLIHATVGPVTNAHSAFTRACVKYDEYLAEHIKEPAKTMQFFDD